MRSKATVAVVAVIALVVIGVWWHTSSSTNPPRTRTTEQAPGAVTTQANGLRAYLSALESIRADIVNVQQSLSSIGNGVSSDPTTWPTLATQLESLKSRLDRDAIKLQHLPVPAELRPAQNAYVNALRGLEAQIGSLATDLADGNIGGAVTTLSGFTSTTPALAHQSLAWRQALIAAARTAGIQVPAWVYQVTG